MGKGSLYDSHVDFMKTHLYDNNENDDRINQDRDTYPEVLSLPAFIPSVFQLSPLNLNTKILTSTKIYSTYIEQSEN